MYKYAALMTLSLGLLMGAQQAAHAEFNSRQFLAPEQHSKVMRVIARGRQQESTANQTNGTNANGNGCGNLVIGDAGKTNSRREPREVIIVARDIINVNSSCQF